MDIVPRPRLRVELAGRHRELVLREAETAEILPLLVDPEKRFPAVVEGRLALEMAALIDTIDGEVPAEEQAQAIVASPAALAAVCQARNAFYDALVASGRVLAACPHCPAGEVELDLLFYWLTLRLPPYRLFDQGVLMGHPTLADPLPGGSRPADLTLARAIGFSYPAEQPLRGWLRPLVGRDSLAREESAWRALAAIERDDDHWHWTRRNTGFRAILRLSQGLAWADGRQATPEEIDRLPLGAYLFLDLLHFATTNVDVSDASRLGVSCPDCGGVFLPVMPTDT